jgi:tRNA pseudouridine38-40 synthase
VKVALLIQYDGSDYCGWQVQPDAQTIQGVVQQALEVVFENPGGLVGSGRTDSGVHALGQVAHFVVEQTPIPVKNIWKVLNRQLPDDIRVIASCAVKAEFHSRFQAIKREYQYSISLQQQILQRNSRWHVRYPVEFQKLQQVSELIVGKHDFSSFCYAGTETENMICNIAEASWSATADSGLIFQVKADRFLHHMVRMLVGSMIEVARAKWDMKRFADLLSNPDRQAQAVTAPARGLALMRVVYPEEMQPVWTKS